MPIFSRITPSIWSGGLVAYNNPISGIGLILKLHLWITIRDHTSIGPFPVSRTAFLVSYPTFLRQKLLIPQSYVSSNHQCCTFLVDFNCNLFFLWVEIFVSSQFFLSIISPPISRSAHFWDHFSCSKYGMGWSIFYDHF